MRLLQVHVGRAAALRVGPREVASAIRKNRVDGPVAVLDEHLDGDECADRRVHGGPRKAVYAYPSEHYPSWRADLGIAELGYGGFGENLTIEGLTEPHVRVGDRLSIGTAEFEVTQPRFPCFKLEAHLDRRTVGPRMLETGRTGFYLTVRRTGRLAAGDAVVLEAMGPEAPTIADVVARRRARELEEASD